MYHFLDKPKGVFYGLLRYATKWCKKEYTPSEILQLTKDGSWGGSLELIEEQTFSGVSAVDFTSIKENVYDVHLLTVSNVDFSGGQSSLGLQFYESGVLETASVYQYAIQYNFSDGTVGESKNTGRNVIFINVANFGYTSTDSGHTYVYLYNLGNSSKYSFVTEQGLLEDSTVMKMSFGGGVLPQASTVDGIRLQESIGGGATVSGTAKLYGVKQIWVT